MQEPYEKRSSYSIMAGTLLKKSAKKDLNLEPGDVIVFENQYYNVPGDRSQGYSRTYVDHIALITSPDKNLIVHSIPSDMSYLHPFRASGICATKIPELNGQIQQEPDHGDSMYDVKYHVYRFNNPKIAERAIGVMNAQSAFRIPYDNERLQKKFDREEMGWDEKEFAKYGEEQYYRVGRYRALKFAARYPSPWTTSEDGDKGHGFTCSMAVITAFQVAEYLVEGLVISPPRTFRDDTLISDKNGTLDPEKQYSPEYLQYLNEIRAKNSPSLKLGKRAVSADSWAGSMPIEAFVHKTFTLDSGCTGAAGIGEYLKNNSQNWTYLGIFELNREENELASESVASPSLVCDLATIADASYVDDEDQYQGLTTSFSL